MKVLPTNMPCGKVSPSSESLMVSPSRGIFLITLYNVAKLPLFFLKAGSDRERILLEDGKNDQIELRVRNTDVGNKQKGK